MSSYDWLRSKTLQPSSDGKIGAARASGSPLAAGRMALGAPFTARGVLKVSEQQEDEADELAERQRRLETVFGPADPLHLHGVIPFAFGFEMGGTADALSFSSFSTDGILYVSCELVGSPNQPR